MGLGLEIKHKMMLSDGRLMQLRATKEHSNEKETKKQQNGMNKCFFVAS